MSSSCVNRINRWLFVVVCAIIIASAASSQAWANDRIHLSLDTVGIAPGQTATLRVWLTNPLDSIAAMQIWLRVDRPNFVLFGTNVDTSGTILSGWDLVEARSVGGTFHDLLLTALCNDANPPVVVPYPPHTNRNLLVKVPLTMPVNPDTLFENLANLSVEIGFNDRFAFSNPQGENIVITQTIVSDTDCFQCQQWIGPNCLAWTQVAVGPCDSTRIIVDTLPILDTTAFQVDNGQAILLNCSSVPMVADVNLDGTPMTIADFNLLARYIAGDTSGLPLPQNADINGDCQISWEDARILSNYFIYGQPYLDTIVMADCTCPNPVRVCCDGTRGNVSSQLDQRVDLSDLSQMVSYITGSGLTLKCLEEANINGVGPIDLSDLSTLISYLVLGGSLPACP